ncbi:MAG: DUF5372 family protein [Candidatus Dormibacteraceae bacterium]
MWRRPSTTDDQHDSRRFRVVHPFHPLTGREFELVSYAHTWGEHRVFFRVPGEDRIRAMPAEWSDVQGPDPFLVLSGGRSCFRVEDLHALAELIQKRRGGKRK